MESTNVTLTVVQLDLVKSSESTSVIEQEMSVEGTRLFINRIKKEFVEKAFNLVINRSEYDLIQSLGGDGYRISFKDVDKAYQFVNNFAKIVEEYNAQHNIKNRIFRIAATTGEVYFDKSESGANQIIGHFVLATLSRLVTAAPGWFYVDKTTFDILPDDVKQDFTKESVKGKKHEDDFDAWRCQIFSDTSIPTIQPITVDEIYKLFDKLNQSSQITRVAQLIEMPNDFRPSNSANLHQAKTAIVEWAEGYENGEEYRLTRLKRLKNIILQLSVNT